MRLVRLGQLMAAKYAVAENVVALENQLRKKIDSLWLVPNKTHNVLKVCSEAGARKAGTPEERLAIAGQKFCQELLGMIDYLKVNRDKIGLGQLREVILNLINLVNDNKGFKARKDDEAPSVQFPHVSELIFQMFASGRKHDRKLRDEQYSKAKTGLSRILSIALSAVEDLDKLEVAAPEKFTHRGDVDIDQKLPGRFEPQRAPLSENDIVDFIRQHGAAYGIMSKDDWEVVVRNNPSLREQLTTVINALNRGHVPADASHVKMQVADILSQYHQKQQTNAPLFEEGEE